MKLAALLACLSMLSCDDSFARGWKLDRLRVLGARVEAAGDPDRASLAPGEAGSLTWLVRGPEPTPALSWTFAACTPPSGEFAEPRCETPVLLTGSGRSEGDLVRMDLARPGAEAELLVLAAFCSHGVPTLDAAEFRATCDGGAPLLASIALRLDQPNSNPAFTDDAFRLGDLAWPAAGLDAGCSDELPRVAPLTPARTIRLSLRQADREVISDGSHEVLVVSSFADDGVLDRQFSVQEAEPYDRLSIDWTPPAAPIETARVVHFVFVLRDGRGGTAFARRALCLGGAQIQRNQP